MLYKWIWFVLFKNYLIISFETDLDPYSEQRRAGFWRTLTVRDFRSDCMIIVSVNQHMDEIQMSNNIIINIKTALVKRFISSPKNSMGTLTPLQFYCNSLYWCVQTGPTSDCTSRRYELLAGFQFILYQNNRQSQRHNGLMKDYFAYRLPFVRKYNYGKDVRIARLELLLL